MRGFRNRKQERRKRALEQQKAKQRLARQIARKEVSLYFEFKLILESEPDCDIDFSLFRKENSCKKH